MVEVQVSGQYKAVENKVFTLKNYVEVFILEDKHLALNIIQNKLIDKRLREKHPLFNSRRTCSIDYIKEIPAAQKKDKKIEYKSIRDFRKLNTIAELKEFCLFNGYPANLTKAKDLKHAMVLVEAAIKAKAKKVKAVQEHLDELDEDGEAMEEQDPLVAL